MSNTFSLFKLFCGSIISPEIFAGEIKKGPKGIAKLILIGLIFAYVIGGFVFLMVALFLGTYKTLSSYGMQNLMPLLSFTVSAISILFFGFITAATSYCTGSGEEQLLSLPLLPKEILAAKYFVTSISDGLFGAAILGTAGVIYGKNEGLLLNPVFWITLVSSIIFITFAAVFIIYLFLILLLTIFPGLRKKKLLTTVASVLVFIFAIGFSMISSQAGTIITEGLGDIISNETASQMVASNFFFIKLFDTAFRGNILCALVFLAVTALIIFIFMPLLSELYIKSLDGFSDVKSKKYSAEDISSSLEKEAKGRGIFRALLVRDIQEVLREPSFIANGPLFVILFPALILVSSGVSFINASGKNFSELLEGIHLIFQSADQNMMNVIEFWVILVGSIFVSFIGTFANIASTSFSREGKGLSNLKSMPISFKTISQAKIAHSLIYCGIAYIEFLILLVIAKSITEIPFSGSSYIKIIITTLITGTSISMFLIYIDILLDAFNPKLNWENPTMALKKNMNILFSVLGTMAVAFIIVLGALRFYKFGIYTILALTAIFIVLDVSVRLLYFRYGERRFLEMQ